MAIIELLICYIDCFIQAVLHPIGARDEIKLYLHFQYL